MRCYTTLHLLEATSPLNRAQKESRLTACGGLFGSPEAGLAMSYHLRQRGREHVILERRRVAERWRTERWDSLRFQLPNRWLELPGKSYAGTDPDGFLHHSDVLRFVLDYATEIAAPVRTGIEVTSLSRDEDSRC